jgi:RHS repeat-associated protein
VDGNTDGNYWDYSVSHTDYNTQGWWQVDLGSSQAIGTINVWNRTDCCGSRLSNFYVLVSDNPFQSTDLTTSINQAGVSSYYTAGQGGSPTSIAINRTGRYVRVQLAGTDYLALAEVQVLSSGGGSAQLQWLVSDQLGTPRMIADKSGSLAKMSRHDYLPFGEELYAGSGGRTTSQGYSGNEGVREQFTGYERDQETGLDYAHARYYANAQGRFTSPDPFGGSMSVVNPQSLNRYSYVTNNPLNGVDPSGMSGHAAMMTTPSNSRSSFNPTVTGIDIIAEDEAAYGERLEETYAAVADAEFLNHAQATGAMSSEEAAVIASGNPMLREHAQQRGKQVPNVESVKIKVIDYYKGNKEEVVEGGLFDVTITYQSNISPDEDVAYQRPGLTGRIEEEAELIGQPNSKFKESVDSETYRYEATFHYRAKNVVDGDGNGHGTASITFKVAIYEGRPGMERVTTDSKIDPSTKQLHPKFYWVSVRDTIPGRIKTPHSIGDAH